MRRQKLQKQKNKENRATQKENKTERNEQRKEQINERSEKRGEESDRDGREWSTPTSCSLTDSEVSNRNVSWADDHFQLATTLLPSTASPLQLLL